MKGFVTGTLVLIALEVFTRKNNVDKVAGGTSLLISATQRLLSAGVAGIPNTVKAAPAATTPSGGADPSGYSAPRVGQTPTTQYV